MTSTPIPNNIGPTFLIMLAVALLPLGIGLPLLLIGLAQVRTVQGQLALPRLHRALRLEGLPALPRLGRPLQP